MPPFDVFGAIGEKWRALDGGQGVLGVPVSDEIPTFDDAGRFRNFSGGVISWHPQIGASYKAYFGVVPA